MKLFKNQAGFSDVIIVSLLGGILGSLFILGVFVWKEIELFNTTNKLNQFINKIIDVKKDDKVDKKNNAWEVYTNEALGFTFKYPTRFGRFDLSISDSSFYGSFSDYKYLTFGSKSYDVQLGRGVHLLDFSRYIEINGSYEFKSGLLEETIKELKPLKILETSLGDFLLLNDQSLKMDRDNNGSNAGISVGGGNLAALINLDNEIFPGMAIHNRGVVDFSQEEFEKMLSTFKFLDGERTTGEVEVIRHSIKGQIEPYCPQSDSCEIFYKNIAQGAWRGFHYGDDDIWFNLIFEQSIIDKYSLDIFKNKFMRASMNINLPEISDKNRKVKYYSTGGTKVSPKVEFISYDGSVLKGQIFVKIYEVTVTTEKMCWYDDVQFPCSSNENVNIDYYIDFELDLIKY